MRSSISPYLAVWRFTVSANVKFNLASLRPLLTGSVVVAVLAVEYALVGLMAGLLGSVGAVGLAWVIVSQLMRLAWRTDWVIVGVAVLVSAGACAMVGVLANARALRVRPAEVLRGE